MPSCSKSTTCSASDPCSPSCCEWMCLSSGDEGGSSACRSPDGTEGRCCWLLLNSDDALARRGGTGVDEDGCDVEEEECVFDAMVCWTCLVRPNAVYYLQCVVQSSAPHFRCFIRLPMYKCSFWCGAVIKRPGPFWCRITSVDMLHAHSAPLPTNPILRICHAA